MPARSIKTARRRFRVPQPGAVYSLDDIPLLVDCPSSIVAAAAKNGSLRVTNISGVDIVDGPDLVEWVKQLDTELSGTAA